MIIKLVYGKEIHVYDLKANESLDYLTGKVRDLFKKVPSQFILVYRNPQQQSLMLTTNQELDLLIDSIKNEVKILKLFIEECRKPIQTETKSEQKLQVKPSAEFDEMTQKIEFSLKMDQYAERLAERSSSNEQTQLPNQSSQQSINIPTQVTVNWFQNMSIDEFKYDGKPFEFRDQLSDRELLVKNGQPSDPKQLRNSTYNQLKQNFIQEPHKTSSKDHQQQPPLQEKPISQKSPVSQQIEQPIVDQLIEDDFLSHHARCDICNAFPICGTRYKCVVCLSYDLCEKCEQKHGHDHPVLKIRYTFQTPININVEIPEYRQRPKPQKKFFSQKIDLQELSPGQRRQRVLSLSSEIAELLNKDLQQCNNFVQKNQEYTKETLIHALIEKKDPAELIKSEKSNPDENQGVTIGFLNKMKGLIFGPKRLIDSNYQNQA